MLKVMFQAVQMLKPFFDLDETLKPEGDLRACRVTQPIFTEHIYTPMLNLQNFRRTIPPPLKGRGSLVL
jgi:hypothetical protein